MDWKRLGRSTVIVLAVIAGLATTFFLIWSMGWIGERIDPRWGPPAVFGFAIFAIAVGMVYRAKGDLP